MFFGFNLGAVRAVREAAIGHIDIKFFIICNLVACNSVPSVVCIQRNLERSKEFPGGCSEG